jgi:hypothetical protein
MVITPPPAGSYAYGLNMFLPATLNSLQTNSKRVLRDFRLTSVNSAYLASVTDWSLILGTELVDWFSDYVQARTILGDAVLQHFLPNAGAGMVIQKGDFLVCQARNDNTTAKRIALIFQGEHI